MSEDQSVTITTSHSSGGFDKGMILSVSCCPNHSQWNMIDTVDSDTCMTIHKILFSWLLIKLVWGESTWL